MDKKITGIVMAGGKSSRMGTNKALIEYNGSRLIDNAINIIQPFVNDVIISSNIPINKIKFPIIEDKIRNLGPIGGIYTCLEKSKTEINIIIPCDVPNIPSGFYSELLEYSNDYDVVVPRLNDGKLEPLVGVYSKSVLTEIEEQIQIRDYKLINLLNKLNVKYVDVSDSLIFKNINSLNDIELPKWNNLFLVAGTNRNVGKTTFACEIIKKISRLYAVNAIKITPHFHELLPNLPVIYKSDNLVIVEEIHNLTGKDSSKMLEAGANHVYYVQAKDDQLKKAIEVLKPLLPKDGPVICESAALRHHIEPGCFVVLSHSENKSKNKALISLANVHIEDYKYEIGTFSFEKGIWNF